MKGKELNKKLEATKVKQETCELCERKGVRTTVHHLTPKEEGGTFKPTADLCVPCHKHIHAVYTNKEIASRLTTIKELKRDEKVSKFIKWIRKQPAETIPKIKKANRRKKR
ncbi:HNH endonuclease [Shouchella sp. JSM 1781072]|uniref:hypothetical protein n=1 Tax=Bacillaceae TaxID=186817 RepID=UPI000C06E36D|nr:MULTISPECIES: hypothetical protein [Bacillaceae]UTR08531.1 HNH endonuclease [Alkalihalobacillus sp. LMS6]